MSQEVRICVCGDEGTGKSSLIASLVKDVFITNKIQAVLPQIAIPPNIGTPENVTTTIVDTSARPQDRNALRKEIRKCNVILLIYADHYSYERVALFWMPYFRSLGVNVPVVLCANKSDLAEGGPEGAGSPPGHPGHSGSRHSPSSSHEDVTLAQVVDEEMVPIMQEFREIDSCIRASARKHHNVNEVFFLCQKAVTHPIAPLFDYKEGNLKPACVAALRRIFFLCDKDQDGFLNDREMYAFQETAFHRPLAPEDLASIKLTLARTRTVSSSVSASASLASLDQDRGIDLAGFLQLNRIYAEKGRHETIWVILRQFHYTDSLSLEDGFLHPRFDVPEYASAELSPVGYRFFVDLFLLFDQDNDGGLNDAELAALFAPTPGLPSSWIEAGFPASTVRNEAGYITLQGWLAQWSMTTFLEPKTTLEYLAYLGFDGTSSASTTTSNNSAGMGGSRPPATTTALKVTRPRPRRRLMRRRTLAGGRLAARVDRNVVLCYVVGAPGAGKSSLLDAFLGQPLDGLHRPTIRPRRAVNSVELEGGKQCYLILEELGELEAAVLENPARLDVCDLLCLTYDSSDPDSFGHLVALREGAEGTEAVRRVLSGGGGGGGGGGGLGSGGNGGVGGVGGGNGSSGGGMGGVGGVGDGISSGVSSGNDGGLSLGMSLAGLGLGGLGGSTAHTGVSSSRAKAAALLDDVPVVYVALKADRDKTMQRSLLQPDAYTGALHVSAPVHVSVTWESISELFVTLAEVATHPSLGFPKSDEPAADRTSLYVALGAVACAAAAAFMISTSQP